jgi:hypothetical protein
MTSQALKLKVKATRAYQRLNEAASYAQFDDEFGLVDIVCVEDCESIIKELKDIYEQQVRLELGLSLEE